MRNTLLILFGVGFIYFSYVVMRDWYNGVEANLDNRNDKKIQEQVGVAGYEEGKSRTAMSSMTSTSAPSHGMLVIPKLATITSSSSLTNIFICYRDINAYNPTNSTLQIGTFRKDTRLIVGSKEHISGKYFVFYQPKEGKMISALCKPEDLGKSN
jgi:hypothetical protein